MAGRKVLPAFLLSLFLSVSLGAYTPESEIKGSVKSIRTYKKLLLTFPAGTIGEPWFPNADYREDGSVLFEYYYEMGQEVRRHKFLYEEDGRGREKTTWYTYILTPDLRPPRERMAGYEHWFRLNEDDEPEVVITRFETVMNHPVKEVYRYYDSDGQLVKETDTFADLDISLTYDLEGRLIEKKGYRGKKTFWQDRYYFDEMGRLVTVTQSDLNRELFQQERYTYEEDRLIFEKYLLEKPVTAEEAGLEPLGSPWYRTVKYLDDKDRLAGLENFRWNGPQGMVLTEKLVYAYDDKDRLVRVEEVNKEQTWEFAYDSRDNWIRMETKDFLNRPDGDSIVYLRVIEYFEEG